MTEGAAPAGALEPGEIAHGALRGVIAALAADHLLYGFVLSETRRRPQG